ncbi:MAG: hypothetical protein K8R54_19025 [Bacteroidales bacterium]|nr:hypothetical protein [Bacteroidales bacterium]
MRDILFIILVTILFSCQNEQKEVLNEINSFYYNKSELLRDFDNENKRDSLRNELVAGWERIMAKRYEAIDYLITLEKDTSYTLYGNDYTEKYFVNQKLPNNIHALYLIECIIQDDYLFNRRYATKAAPEMYFKNDDINFLYDTLKGVNHNNLIVKQKTDFKDYKDELKAAWVIYKEWHKKNHDIKKVSPLQTSSIKWYSYMEYAQEKGSLNQIIKDKEDSWIKKLYHLDYVIGDRWGVLNYNN